MIRALTRVVGPAAEGPLKANTYGVVFESVLTGIGFVLLVPILRHLAEGEHTAAGWWLASLATLLVIYVALRFRTQLMGYQAAIKLGRSLFRRIGEHIASLPLGWFSDERAGELSRMTGHGVVDIIGIPAHLLRPYISALATPITVIALMFLFDWRLALAATITAPAAVLIMRWFGSLVERHEHRVNAAAVEAVNRIVEFGQAQPVLRAFGHHGSANRKLEDAFDEQHAAGRNLLVSAAGGLLSFVVLLQFAFTIVLLFGTNLALGGEIDAPELVALLVLSARYIEPLIMAADLEGALRISGNSLRRLDDLFAIKPLSEADTTSAPKGSMISFEKVAFSYDNSAPLLRDVSFTVPAKTMTAIVGPSGSGKTTLLRLIPRFWDVDAGAITLGGSDIRALSTVDLMAQVSIVFQDVYLFDGTIAENIRLGRPDASDEEVAEAARLACVDEIADRLPGGFEARVGEGGAILSGGERQRVSVARAMLKDAPIILLDEATAALDPINEAAVQRGLKALTANKTLIVVAHRLKTVRAADQILVLDDGTITERGNHEELRSANGRYTRFWNERSRAAGWRIASGWSCQTNCT